MKNSLDVFDFKEEDELPEFEAGKLLGKFKNPNNDASTVLGSQVLECVSQETSVQQQGIGNVLCLNIDAVDSAASCDNAIGAPQLDSKSFEQSPNCEKDYCGSGSHISELVVRDSCAKVADPLGKSLLCGGSLELSSNNEPVDVNSDVDGSMKEGSGLSPASDTAPDNVSLNGHVSDHWIDDSEEDDIKMAVVISPDYVVYRNNYCSGYLVIFSCTGIKIKDSTACGNEGTFSLEKRIDDIVDIKFQWLQRFGSVLVRLHVLSSDMVLDDVSCGTSGIEELKFAVDEPNWSETLDKITSLNAKYMALWVVDYDYPVETDGDISLGQRHYFPNFDKPFEDVVYPEGDSDAVSISKRDVDLLQPDSFVNDTIIDFYIKYLKNQIPAEEKHRFHFFNSFFFRKLADLDKDPSSISDGKAAFLRVRKWTRKVDMFQKDYIFIPVNFNLHWSLIVICHPGEVATFKDEDLHRLEKVPCILHMDSIKGTHAGLKNLVQSYLWEEWKERHKDTLENVSSQFLYLRFVPVELPQQENSFDCGLFLLHYLELFLAEAPVSFSPFKLSKHSNFLNVDWFPPAEASLKRTLIERLIFELLQSRSREVTSSLCRDEDQSPRFQENNANETGVEFSSQKCCAAMTHHGNLSNSQANKGIEITLLGATSTRNLQCVSDSGLVLREFFEPRATAGSLLAQYQCLGQPSYYHLSGAASTREQDEIEPVQEYGYLQSEENDFQQITGLTPQANSIPYSSRVFETESSWNPEICIQGEQDIDSPEPSLCASDDSEDVGIIEHSPFLEDASQSLQERIDHQRSPSMDNIGCLKDGPDSVSSEMLQTSTVEGSEEPDKMHDNNDNIDIPSGQENLPTLLQYPNLVEQRLDQESDVLENGEIAGDDTRVTNVNILTESYEQRAAKRPRLTPLEGEGLMESQSKDLHS